MTPKREAGVVRLQVRTLVHGTAGGATFWQAGPNLGASLEKLSIFRAFGWGGGGVRWAPALPGRGHVG